MERDNRKLNIKIITTESFPIGLAATNRITSYAKGFIENNCKVFIYCLRPTEKQDAIFNKFSSGVIDGIDYKYFSGSTVLNKNFINRRIDNIKGIFKISIALLKEKKRNKTDAIIYYSPSTSRAIILFFITRLRKILFLKEESELPVVYEKKMFLLQKIIFKKFHYLLFDGYLLMTEKLIKFFREEKQLNLPYLHVPMTVDFERFNNIVNNNTKIKYIAYCGVLNNMKDGVDLLIDAFALLAKDFPDIHLYLIGNAASQEEYQLYKKKINENMLDKRVYFTGRISKDAMPELLCNAKILVLARPHSIQAEGGFPTKLGEYLSTGKPVVVTSVGEVANYLTDEINVFMAEPGSILSLVAKMKKILLNYSYALAIGENGKKVVLEHFNYKIQSNNIINFIKSFKKCVV